MDALENALRAESKFVSPAPSLRRRSLVSGSQVKLCPSHPRSLVFFPLRILTVQISGSRAAGEDAVFLSDDGLTFGENILWQSPVTAL